MPHERDDWISRVKAIEREYSALRLAATRLQEHAQTIPESWQRRTSDFATYGLRLESLKAPTLSGYSPNSRQRCDSTGSRRNGSIPKPKTW
jgi:hypothetical protein